MDVSLTHTSNTTTTTTGSPKSPEPDPDTPTRAAHPSKPSHFSNGVLKRHNGLAHHPAVPPSPYKECLRNHAASLGGHALDGCLEFMPSPASTPSDPTSLKCAACSCHRNFHRREPDHPAPTPPPLQLPAIEYQPHHRHHPPPPPPPPPQPFHPPAPSRSPSSASPPPISSQPPSSTPHMLLVLSAAPENSVPPPQPLRGLASSLGGGSGPARKRFRTKFSQSQKERMFEFAERVGWRMQKRDDDAIREFCNEVGVDRGVFKVWMHNNKNTFGKPRVVLDHFGDNPDSCSPRNPGTSNSNPVIGNGDSPLDPDGGSTTQDLFRIHHDHHIQHHEEPPTGTNGSSSSS